MRGSWTHLVLEVYCEVSECPAFGSSFCLETCCRQLGWCQVKARDVAHFVPMRLIIWDRVKALTEDIYWKLWWWFWGSWHRRTPVWEDD